MNFLSIRRTVLFASLIATPALAQTAVTTNTACDPIGSARGPIGKAYLSIQRAGANLTNNTSAVKDLQDVIRTLAGADDAGNPLAKNFLLGEAYALLTTQQGISIESPRSAVGLTTNPTGMINLFAAADTSLSLVEQLAPNCVETVSPFRRVPPWVVTLNSAFGALSAGNLDSAEFYAKRALLIERKAPYAYSVLGSVAAKRKDFTAANDYWTKALAAAGTDSTYADVKMKTMYELADALSSAANSATGADKQRLARQAIAAWNNYLTVSTDDYFIADTIDRLMALYKTAGDSASMSNIYTPILANPSKYGENALVHAGVVATRSGHSADGVKLFEAAHALNPYSRDALYNLALTYYGANQPEKMFPIVKELTTLDPSNPDDQLLYAFAYQALYKTATSPKLKKVYTDSLVYFNALSENSPVKVAVTDFVRGDKETTLGGTIENHTAAAKTYTLSVEFLNKAGSVVGTQQVTVGPVAAKSSQAFKVTVPVGGVYGFRYKPVS
jgi:Putative Zn-dependent protease, contains TPR repeats